MGATVIESPVWIPIGSRFSMPHTMTTLSLVSLMTSSSISFHPTSDSSMRTSRTGLVIRAFPTFAESSECSVTMLPPVPPRVRDGRRIRGYPISAATFSASLSEYAMPLRADSRPISSIALRKLSRSSAVRIDSIFAPISSTLYLSNTPLASSSRAVLRAVCPPIVGRTASGLSLLIISST